jgi:hypothetical protein
MRPRPHFSLAVTAGHDDRDDDREQRMPLFIHGLMRQANHCRLPLDLIVVA